MAKRFRNCCGKRMTRLYERVKRGEVYWENGRWVNFGWWCGICKRMKFFT